MIHFRSQQWSTLWPWPLPFWPWDWWALYNCPCGRQPSYPFWCFCDFSFSTYRSTRISRTSHHITSRPWHFDVGGHGICLWYGSSYFICISSLKFVGHSIWKMWHTFGLSISQPSDLDVWPSTLILVRIIARLLFNFPINFGVSRTIRFRLIRQHLSDASRDLATLTFDLRGHGAGLRAPSVYQVRSS